jgi:hypothetical protein
MVAAGEIVVRVASLENASPRTQAGVMMRDGSQAVVMDVDAEGGVEFMARLAPGEPSEFIAGGTAPLPAVSDAQPRHVHGAVSATDAREVVGTTTAPLGAIIESGLVVSRHDTGS